MSGLIPAHAGKTHLRRAVPGWAWAHPRSRGENFGSVMVNLAPAGSSPLTRGKLQRVRMCRVMSGLIPTHAGKTLCLAFCFVFLWAHPRSRGENYLFTFLCVLFPGSSPLTRGKLKAGFGKHTHLRLIPAHAGKTITRHACRSPRRAHPRSRGENQRRTRLDLVRAGSSPLTRGKLIRSVRHVPAPGLIPAHAGKTGRWRPRSMSRGAHPRSRGENSYAT